MNKKRDTFPLVWIVLASMALLLLVGQAYKYIVVKSTGDQQLAQVSQTGDTVGPDLFRKDGELEEPPEINCQRVGSGTQCKIKTLDATFYTIGARASVGAGRNGNGLVITLDPPASGVTFTGGGVYIDFFAGTPEEYAAALASGAITRDVMRLEPGEVYAFGIDLQRQYGISSLRSQITYAEWSPEDQKVRTRTIASPIVSGTAWTTVVPLEYQTTVPTENDEENNPSAADVIKLRKTRYYLGFATIQLPQTSLLEKIFHHTAFAQSATSFSIDNPTGRKRGGSGGGAGGDSPTAAYCRGYTDGIPRPQKCQKEHLDALGFPDIDDKGTPATGDDVLVLKTAVEVRGLVPPSGYNYIDCGAEAGTSTAPSCRFCKSIATSTDTQRVGEFFDKQYDVVRLRKAGTLKCDKGKVINKCYQCGTCPSTNPDYPGVIFDERIISGGCCAAFPTSTSSDPFLKSFGANSQCAGILVSAVTNGCHSETGGHYEGCAVDLNIVPPGDNENTRIQACINALGYIYTTQRFPIEAGKCKYHDGHMHCKTC